MSTINKLSKKPGPVTHEGAKASRINPLQQLRRSVLSCMLWESEFYEDGAEISTRICELIKLCKKEDVADLAIEARNQFKLRHVPLLLARELVRMGGSLAGRTLTKVIQRPDELTEFLALYWKDGKCPLSKQVKLGLAGAFGKFDEYQLAKYNRQTEIKLRDVLFLCHAKPKGAIDRYSKIERKSAPRNLNAYELLYKRVVDGNLSTPDTWESQLVGGKDKKETFLRLMAENKLGGLAFLRNLRNMHEAGIDRSTVFDYSKRVNLSRVLPFRFVSAARAVPQWESICDDMLLSVTSQIPKLTGKTVVVIDVSGSMYGAKLSDKSGMTRALAACALGAIMREICADPYIYATAGYDSARKHKTTIVPDRRGMGLVSAIHDLSKPLGGGGIFLKQVMDYIENDHLAGDIERVVVITDEQDCGNSDSESPSKAKFLGKRNYLINVASAKNGIGYGRWIHIDGFSEAVINWIFEFEKEV